jgi:hypothetical protein
MESVINPKLTTLRAYGHLQTSPTGWIMCCVGCCYYLVTNLYSSYKKSTIHTNFLNLFWNETTSEWNCSSILILLESCQQTCMTYTIAVCTVKNTLWWTEELSLTCRVSFHNKFEKLVHLVGFIIKICHDARSHERKIYISWIWHFQKKKWNFVQLESRLCWLYPELFGVCSISVQCVCGFPKRLLAGKGFAFA